MIPIEAEEAVALVKNGKVFLHVKDGRVVKVDAKPAHPREKKRERV